MLSTQVPISTSRSRLEMMFINSIASRFLCLHWYQLMVISVSDDISVATSIDFYDSNKNRNSKRITVLFWFQLVGYCSTKEITEKRGMFYS